MIIMTHTKQRDYYTVTEAAHMLDVSPSTIWRWIKQEKLPAYRVAEHTIRIKYADLERIVRPVQERDEHTEIEQAYFASPSPVELARRRDLVARIRSARRERKIAPMTSDQLVHKSREKDKYSYDANS